ncbi:MAG: hypothetical protein ACFB8W_07770 [Elainellaceae cyanobacterium]
MQTYGDRVVYPQADSGILGILMMFRNPEMLVICVICVICG